MDEPAQAHRFGLEAVDPARLVGGVGGGRQQAGGDEDQHQPGDLEELREVDVDAAAVEADADQHRGEQAEDRARAGGGRVGRVLEGGEEEDRGLEALAQHREEGHPDQRHRRAAGQRARRLALEFGLDRPRVAGHPDDHVADRRHRDQADDRLQPLLLFLRQFFADDVEADADRGAEDDRDRRPRSTSGGARRGAPP